MTFVPPVLVIVKLLETVAPTWTLPYSTFSGVNFRTPGWPALPVSAIAETPALVCSTSSPLKLPSAVGSKATSTLTASPGPSTLPGAGAPLTANGAVSEPTDSIVRGAPPTLRKVAAEESLPPTLVPPNESTVGDASTLASAGWPVPCNEKVNVPELVSTVSVAACRPLPVGLKVTGTWSV